MLDRSFLKGVAKNVQDVVKQVTETFKQPSADKVPDQILSGREQLERFMLLQPEHLKQLRDTHGDAEFSRYVNRMRDLSKQVK